jgi:hypothetical protein
MSMIEQFPLNALPNVILFASTAVLTQLCQTPEDCDARQRPNGILPDSACFERSAGPLGKKGGQSDTDPRVDRMPID